MQILLDVVALQIHFHVVGAELKPATLISAVIISKATNAARTPAAVEELNVFRLSRLRAPFVPSALCWRAAGAPTHKVGPHVLRRPGVPDLRRAADARPSTPTVPGVDIDVVGSPLIKADGGPVFGGALAFEFGVLGIEGRLDATEVGLEFTGATTSAARNRRSRASPPA